MPAYLYGKITDLRNALYDKGVFETFDLGARSISVGNITAGGTGKTPLVAYIAEVLAARGETVCILTRGYGRKEQKTESFGFRREQVFADAVTGGDEPFELAKNCSAKPSSSPMPTVFRRPNGQNANSASRFLCSTTDFSIGRLNAISTLSASTRPIRSVGGKMLPLGRLREPIAGLARADCIVITRSDLVDDITELRARLTKWNSDAVMFEAKNAISAITPVEEFHAKTPRSQRSQSKSMSQRALAFCGVGNPDIFLNSSSERVWNPSRQKVTRSPFLLASRHW